MRTHLLKSYDTEKNQHIELLVDVIQWTKPNTSNTMGDKGAGAMRAIRATRTRYRRTKFGVDYTLSSEVGAIEGARSKM